MPIQSRKNNNKYNKTKHNKNKRTRKRPLQKGGGKQIFDIKDLGNFKSLNTKIDFFIKKTKFKTGLELIQIDDTIHFFTDKDAYDFRNILEEFKLQGKPASDPIQLKAGSEKNFTEKISEKFTIKPLIYVSSSETIYNPKRINTTGGDYTLFKFKTIKAKSDNEAGIASSVDTKVEVKNDKTSKTEDSTIEKVEADETGGAKAYATIMNEVKKALKVAQNNDNTEETIEAFYQTIQTNHEVFLKDVQPWKAIDLTERNLALKYFSEQKKKLLHEATPILPKTKTDTNTDKGIKTYLNSKEYNESDFKKLAAQFITQNPDITNDAINKLTFP